MAGKYGYPYFSNYVNSDMDPSDARSMCCRLRLDLDTLRRRNGGLFGSGDATGCYDEETEILTTRGWINFKDLTKNDEVYTLSSSNTIELHKPINLFKYDWDGDLVEFKNDRFDLLVTPNHRMAYSDKHTGKRGFVRADEYSFTKHPIPKQGSWSGEYVDEFILPSISNSWVSGNHNSKQEYIREDLKIPMNIWLKFMGLWLSEGSYDNDTIAQSHGYRVVISQSKFTSEVEEVLNLMPFSYRKEGINYIICNKQLWNYVKQLGHCYNKFIPNNLKLLATSQLQILFDYLMLGDGSTRKEASKNGKHQKVYYTSSKQLADDVQELVVKLGFVANIKSRNRGLITIEGRTHKTQDCYEVSVDQGKHFYIKPNCITKKYYKGYVYCCEVPNNTVMVRRNGFVTWCGNSIGVVTINLPRGGYVSETEEELFSWIEEIMHLAKVSLELKRSWLEENIIGTGMIPAFDTYVGTIENHFSTIGYVGLNEMCENFFGKDILSPEGKALSIRVLDYMRGELIKFQQETGHLYNLEATPAESTCYRLAQLDARYYPHIKTRGRGDSRYYTNSCHIPVDKVESIKQLLDHQDELQIRMTGGTVSHLYLGKSVTKEQAKSIVRTSCENYRLPYISISPLIRQCEEHGFIDVATDVCPHCGKPLNYKQRITGYIRDVQNFNPGKLAEFKDRKQVII